jgi:hypothetical protein
LEACCVGISLKFSGGNQYIQHFEYGNYISGFKNNANKIVYWYKFVLYSLLRMKKMDPLIPPRRYSINVSEDNDYYDTD